MPLVLRIVTRMNIGGPSRQVLVLTEGLPSRGFSSEVVTGLEGVEEGSLRPKGRNYTYLSTLRREVSPLHDARAAVSLSRIIRDREPAIVHTHVAKAGTLGRFAASRARCRPALVHTFHGHSLEGYFSPRANQVLLSIEKSLAARTDVLVAVSARIRDELLERGVGRPDQWRVIPLGLNLSPLLANTVRKSDARTSLGLTKDVPLVGIVGRLAPVKDVPLFIEVCRHVASAIPDVHFVIAGDGPLRSQLEGLAREVLGDRVEFLGWVNELVDLYAALDVVVLTSKNEGTPVALIEAAAAGLPVVATDVGGVSDVVQHSQTGYLANMRDANELASYVSSLVEDEALAGSFGRAGRQWVASRFGAERLLDDVASLYSELIVPR